MTAITLIFDLTSVDVATRLGSDPTRFQENLKRYLKEIGLVTCFFNTLSNLNRVISLGAEPAVSQTLKLLGISDSPESYLELGSQLVTKKAAIISKESIQLAANPSICKKTMGFEYAQHLQRGLCFVKRMRSAKSTSELASKTIIINFSPDLNEQTTELMTMFFTYQTFHEKVDILDLSGRINPTLQQGCDITGGRYFAMDKYPKSLLGCIVRNFSISDSGLHLFPAISELEVDYRFPCRCHNRLVDLGYICASCLSVHCRPAVKCVGCGANFMPQITVDELIMKQPSEVLSSRRSFPKRNENIKSEMSKQSCSQFITELNQRLIFNLLDSLEGTKTVVWDRFLMTEVNSIISYQLLKEHNVVSHVCPISNPVVKQTDFIIYILPPSLVATEELVKNHLEKVQTKDQKNHRIVYVPEVSYIHKEKLVSLFPWIDDKISSLQLRWFPTDQENCVSLNLGPLPPAMLVFEDWNELYKCAKAIRQLESQMENQPNIIFKGEWATKVKQILDQLRKSSMESEHVLDGPAVDGIILIDRWLDPVTPLFSQKTFSGVLDELFGIDIQGKIKFETKAFYGGSEVPKNLREKPQFDLYLNDAIYPLLRDTHIDGVGTVIGQLIRECQKEEQNLKSIGSVAQCRTTVNSLQAFLKKKEVLSGYLRMAELCKNELSKFSKSDLIECEMEIVSGKHGDRPIPFLENSIVDGLPLLPIIRLIGLQSQLCNGIKASTWQYYRKLIVQSYGVGVLVWLLRLQMSGIIKCSDNTDRIPPTYKPIDWKSLEKRFRLFVDDPYTEDVARPYNGYVPLLIRIIEEGYLTQFRDWKGMEANRENNGKFEGKKWLLFVVGGITRAEMGLIRKRFPDITDCYVSDVITGDSLLQRFRD